MAKFRGAIVVDTEHCKGCSLCVVACPTKVIELNPDVNGKGRPLSAPPTIMRFRCSPLYSAVLAAAFWALTISASLTDAPCLSPP